MGRLMRRWPFFVAGAPLAVLMLARTLLIALSLAGRPLFWAIEPLTLAEAAALRDGGEVARLLADGADPNAHYPVRRGVVRGRTEATPLEAARAARRPEIVQLLLESGARAN